MPLRRRSQTLYAYLFTERTHAPWAAWPVNASDFKELDSECVGLPATASAGVRKFVRGIRQSVVGAGSDPSVSESALRGVPRLPFSRAGDARDMPVFGDAVRARISDAARRAYEAAEDANSM